LILIEPTVDSASADVEKIDVGRPRRSDFQGKTRIFFSVDRAIVIQRVLIGSNSEGWPE